MYAVFAGSLCHLVALRVNAIPYRTRYIQVFMLAEGVQNDQNVTLADVQDAGFATGPCRIICEPLAASTSAI